MQAFQEIVTNRAALLVIIVVFDLLLGDPNYPLHPVRIVGHMLTFFEKLLRRLRLDGICGGVLLLLLLFVTLESATLGIYHLLGLWNQWLAFAWYIYLGYSFLAIRDLCVHGLRVGRAVNSGNLEQARRETQMLVSRDVDKLDADGCCRAAVESLAENLTDGILSPIFFFLLLGIPGLVFFKIISTMDSMVGYKNEKYLYFGRFGAILDDALNYIPARLSLLLIAAASLILPKCSARSAWRIGLSQHNRLASPNSGWSEAAVAGALQIRLVGPVWYEGIPKDSGWIGDPDHEAGATPQQIKRTVYLVLATTLLAAILGAGVYLAVRHLNQSIL